MNDHKQEFLDFYMILQVHHNAEPEIIKSAYRRLAQMHHPDINKDPQSMFKMQLINQAYDTISDPALRRSYHRIWLGHNQQRERSADLQKRGTAAQQALDDYFRCLLQEDWAAAYEMLSVKDHNLVPLSDFCEWKEAVKALYQMGAYVIKPFRSYQRCVVGDSEYEKVEIFSVVLTDRDNRIGSVSEETYTKYVVMDQGDWRVCLGYTQLKPIIYKLKYLASQAPEMDPSRIYTDTLLKFDKLTGLYSRKGLMESMEKEIARARRFKINFCLAVLSIDALEGLSGISSTDYLHMCLSDAASQLKITMRGIDCAARFSEHRLAVMMIQTNSQAANRALVRFLLAIRPGEGLHYRLCGSITAYQGESAEDTLIRAEHDARVQVIIGKDNVKKYHFKLDDQQV